MATTVFIGVDPGATTGVAAVYYVPGRAEPAEFAVYQVSYDDDPVHKVDELVSDAMAYTGKDVRTLRVRVVAEQFVAEEGTYGVDTTALRVLGALEFLVADIKRNHAYLDLEYLTQLRTAKKSMPNERLRNLGMYSPGQPHANDAMRHVVIHILDRQKGTLAAHNMALRAFPPDVAEG